MKDNARGLRYSVKNGILGVATVLGAIGLLVAVPVLFSFLWLVEGTDQFLFGAKQPKRQNLHPKMK
jgi:hypothetical protein